MIRLFVALGIPESLGTRLSGLRGQIPEARWVPPEDSHITLRFVGEVDEGAAADIDDTLTRVAAEPLDISLRGVGHFGSLGRVRSLWAGVQKSAALEDLQGRVELACQRAGLAPEGRKFHPHVTLARCRDTREERVAGFLSDHAAFHAPAFAVYSFALYSSALGRGGPVYTREVEYPLARP